MINKSDFLTNFSNQFDDLENELTFKTIFHNLEEWSSLVGVCIIAMAKEKYGKEIKGDELRICKNVEDVYNLINNK